MLSGQVDPELRQIADGGFEVGLRLDVQVDLPEQKWKSGQLLHNDVSTHAELVSLTRRAHAALTAGPSEIRHVLGPMIERQAATIGMTVEQYLEHEFILFLDPSLGFELQPFDAAQSQLMIFGNGRLATLILSPVTFVNEAAGEMGNPLLVYWLDSNGDWQIIH